MTETSPPPKQAAAAKRDLRAQLLEASRLLLDECGPAGLSMREVARRTGCTHQAPYHYFADRESILAALVTDGFNTLAARLRAAHDLDAEHGLAAALTASASAYIGFALSERGVFRVMFRPDFCNPDRFPEVQNAGARAREELQRLAGIVRGQDSGNIVLETILWAHVHGLAVLLVDGPIGARFPEPGELEAHLQSVAQEFARQVLSTLDRGPAK